MADDETDGEPEDYEYDNYDEDWSGDDADEGDSEQFMTAEEIADLQVGDLLVWRWNSGVWWTNGKEYELLRLHGTDSFDVTKDDGGFITTDHEGFELAPRPELGRTSLAEDILQGLG